MTDKVNKTTLRDILEVPKGIVRSEGDVMVTYTVPRSQIAISLPLQNAVDLGDLSESPDPETHVVPGGHVLGILETAPLQEIAVDSAKIMSKVGHARRGLIVGGQQDTYATNSVTARVFDRIEPLTRRVLLPAALSTHLTSFGERVRLFAREDRLILEGSAMRARIPLVVMGSWAYETASQTVTVPRAKLKAAVRQDETHQYWTLDSCGIKVGRTLVAGQASSPMSSASCLFDRALVTAALAQSTQSHVAVGFVSHRVLALRDDAARVFVAPRSC